MGTTRVPAVLGRLPWPPRMAPSRLCCSWPTAAHSSRSCRRARACSRSAVPRPFSAVPARHLRLTRRASARDVRLAHSRRQDSMTSPVNAGQFCLRKGPGSDETSTLSNDQETDADHAHRVSGRDRCRPTGGRSLPSKAHPRLRSPARSPRPMARWGSTSTAVIGYTAQAPTASLAAPVPGSQFPAPSSRLPVPAAVGTASTTRDPRILSPAPRSAGPCWLGGKNAAAR
jgi:hypothetical protein